MSSIRVTYSGLISFAIGIATIVTGLLFTLIITRSLSQNDFGTWGLIGSIMSYSLIIEPIISFWSTREVARGEKSGKTAFYSTGIFTSLGILVYVIVALFFENNETVNTNLLLVAAVLVPVEFFRSVLVNISLGFKPHVGEYGLLIFEISKLPLALLVILYFDLGLLGVIASVAIAHLMSIVFLSIRVREKLRNEFDSKFLKKWLKLFWIPSFPKISGVFNNSDIIVYTLMTGSVAGIAYWAAARSVSRIVRHSLRVNKALYPKLLAGGKKEYLQDNLTHVFYFALPLTALSITFARPASYALNPLYEAATPVIIIMSLLVFLRMLGDLFRQSLSGLEKVDKSTNSTFMEYLKSKLFYLPLLTNIHRGVYLVILSIALFLIIPLSLEEIDLVIYWAMIALITQIPFTGYLYFIVRKEFAIRLNYKTLIKYGIATLVSFGITYFLMEKFLVYNESIFQFLPNMLLYVVLASLLYFGITYSIDNKTRKLVHAVLSETGKK